MITDGSASKPVAIVKTGNGDLVPAGSYTYIGTTTVTPGKLTFNGSLAATATTVATLPVGYLATVNTATAGQVRLAISQINSGPSAAPAEVNTTTTSLTATATDNAGEAALTYTWSASGSAPERFPVNGNNAAKNATAVFSAPGSYTITLTVRDVPGLTNVPTTTVNVTATPASISVSPPAATLAVRANLAFYASVHDQFGTPVSNPSVSWSATGGGAVNPVGLYTATAAGGPWLITAASGILYAFAQISVTPAEAVVTLGDLTNTYDGTPKPVTATTSTP